MRGNCLLDRSEWHHGLLPGRGLQPVVCWWLCGLIRRAEGPWASVDPRVPNRSGAINNSPISCGALGSDVAGTTSVQVRTGEPGALWFWYRAIGRQACSPSFCQAFVNMDDEMRSYVFMWRYWSGWKYLKAFVCLYCRYFSIWQHHRFYCLDYTNITVFVPYAIYI